MSDTDYGIGHLETKEQRRVATAVLSVLPANPSGGGCRAFYTPQEWAARGEEFGRESVLILLHDGGDLAPFCNPAYNRYQDLDKLGRALRKIGYYVEQCTCWYSAVYKA